MNLMDSQQFVKVFPPNFSVSTAKPIINLLDIFAHQNFL